MQIKSDGTIETKLVVDGKEFVDSMSQYDRTADAFAQKVSKSVGKVKSDIEAMGKATGMTTSEVKALQDQVSKNMAMDAAAKALANFSEKNRLAASATAELAAKLGVADRLFQSFGASAKAGADKALQSVQAAAQAIQRMQSAMVFDPASNFKASGFDSNFDQFFSNIERSLNTTRAAAKNTGVELSRVIDDFYRATQHSGVVQSKDVAGSMFRESANIEAAFRGAGKALDPLITKIAEVPPALGSAAAAAKAFQGSVQSATQRSKADIQVLAGSLGMAEKEFAGFSARAQRGIEVRVKTDALRRLADDAQLSKKEIASLEKQLGVTLNEAGGIGKQFGQAFVNTAMYGGFYQIISLFEQIPVKIYEATAAMDKFRKSYEGVFGARAGETQNYITTQADMMGKGLIETSKSYLKFAASAEYAGVSTEQARKIFEATSKTVTKVGGTTEDVNGTLVALQQMISKGTVSAEEFRSQFAERIPGAMQMGANAVGVTVAEFRKLMEEGQVISKDFIPKLAMEMENFAVGWEKGAQSIDANMERIKNSVTKILSEMGETDAFAAGLKIAGGLFKGIEEGLKSSRVVEQHFENINTGESDAFSGVGMRTLIAEALKKTRIPGLSTFLSAAVADTEGSSAELQRGIDIRAAQVESLKNQANDYFKILVDIQAKQLDFSPSGESADEMAAKIKELEAQIRRLTGQEWHAYVTVNVNTSQVSKAIAYINSEFAKTSMGKAEDAASSYESGLNAQKILASEISDLQGKLGTALDPREYFSTLSAIEEKNALYARGLEVLAEKQEAAAKAQKDVFDNTSAGQALAHAEKEISAANQYNTAAEKRIQVENEYKQAIERYAPLVNDAALSETQRAKAQEALAAAEKARKGRLDDIATAEERAAKAASRSGASAAKAAQQAENFLASLSDQIAMVEAALSGDSVQSKLAQVDKRWNEWERRVGSAKLSAEQAAEAMAQIDRARGLERQSVEAQALAESLRRVADIMGDIADASGSPDLKIKAGLMDLEAWEKQARQAIDQATQDEAQRAELRTALEQGVALKRLEINRDAYEAMSSVSSKYWDAEKALVEEKLAVVKESAEDELAYKIYAAQQWDDYNRRKLEAQANAPRNLGEAIQAVFALDSGSYKSAMGQLQDEWKRTAERMLSLSNDLSEGIAQGLGDALRGLASGDIKSFEDAWKSMLNRLLDSFISFLEDMLAEWLKKNVFGALLGGSSSGGGAGVGDILSALSGGGNNARYNGGYSTHDGRSTLSYGYQGNQYANPSGGWWSRNGTAALGAAAGMATAAGGFASGNTLMGIGGGLMTAGSLLTLVNPVVGGLVAGIGGLVSIFSGMTEQEKKKEAQPVWQGRATAWLGGSMLGYGYTQMDDGSYKISAIDPAELDAARKAFQENVDSMNEAMKALEIDFTKGWERSFSFVGIPVPDELQGAVEFVMRSQAAAYALGDLANAVAMAQDGYESLDAVLIRLGEAFATVKPRVESMGMNLVKMSGITDDQVLQYAAVSKGLSATSDELMAAMERQALGYDDISDATVDVINYFKQFKTQLSNILAAQYSELLVKAAGDEDAFEAAIERFSEGAFTSREQVENALSYYLAEFKNKSEDASSYLPGFDVSWIKGNVDAFWAAYQEAMDSAMPPSAFGWWSEISAYVSGLQEMQRQLEAIEFKEWAFDKGLEHRRLLADDRTKEADALKSLIDAEQELAEARASSMTYAQQLALVETQIYELEAQLRKMLNLDVTGESYDSIATTLENSFKKQAQLMQEQALLAQEAADAYRSAADSIRDVIEDLTQSAESVLDPGAKYKEALNSYKATYNLALTGNRTALSEIGGQAQTMLSALQKSTTDPLEYRRAYYKTLNELNSLADTSDDFADKEDLLKALSEIQAALLSTMQSILAAFGDPDLLLEAEDLLAILQDPTKSLSDYLGNTIDFDATRTKIQTAQVEFLEAVLSSAGTELEGLTETFASYNISGSVATSITAQIRAIQDALANRSTEDAVKAVQAFQAALPGYSLPAATTAALSDQLGAVLVELTGTAAAASLQSLKDLEQAVTDFEEGDIDLAGLTRAFQNAQVQIVDTVTLTALSALDGFEKALAAYTAGDISFAEMYVKFSNLQHGLISDTITNATDVLEKVKTSIEGYVAGEESYAALVVLFEEAQNKIAATGNQAVLRELESLRKDIAAYEADPNTATKAILEFQRVQDLLVSGGALAALEALAVLRDSLDAYDLDAATQSSLVSKISALEQSLVVTSTDAAAKEIETLLAAIGSFGLPASIQAQLIGQLTDLQATLTTQGALAALEELAEVRDSIAAYAIDASMKATLLEHMARIQRELVVTDATAAQKALDEILLAVSKLELDAGTKSALIQEFTAVQDALTYAGTVAAYLASMSLRDALSGYDLSATVRADLTGKLSAMQDALSVTNVAGAVAALTSLQKALADYDLPEDVRAKLETDLSAAQSALSKGNVSGALAAIDKIKSALPGYKLEDDVASSIITQLNKAQYNLVITNAKGARAVLSGILETLKAYAVEQDQVQMWIATLENQQLLLIRQGVKGAREELVALRTAVTDYKLGKTDFAAFQAVIQKSQLGILDGAVKGAMSAIQDILNVGSPVASEALRKLLEEARVKITEKLLGSDLKTIRGASIDTEAQLKAALSKNTLDISQLSSAQASILKAQIDSLYQVSLAVGKPIDISQALLDALQDKIDGTAQQEDWAKLIEAMDTYRDDVVAKIQASITSRQSEARSLQDKIDKQLQVQSDMKEYFKGIQAYLVRQTKVETLTAQISALKDTQSSANNSAMMAMIMGVPMAAISHMQTAQGLSSQIATLEKELALWTGMEIPTSGVSGVTDTGKTAEQVVSTILSRSSAISKLVTDASASGLTTSQKNSLVSTLKDEITRYQSMSTWKVQDASYAMLLDAKLADFYAALKGVETKLGVDIPGFAEGGISWTPQLAYVAETGPEAHVPLKNGKIPVDLTAPWKNSGDGYAELVAEVRDLKRQNTALMKEIRDNTYSTAVHASDTKQTNKRMLKFLETGGVQ